MLGLDEVAGLVGVRRTELTAWIEQRWILPVEEDGQWRFADVDVARIRLIVELRQELDIGADALPVVLSLLDQVHALRRSLRDVCDAVATLPEEHRDAVRRYLERRYPSEERG